VQCGLERNTARDEVFKEYIAFSCTVLTFLFGKYLMIMQGSQDEE
jgi:hypothetical protein